jgi:hypothetical protein
MQPGGQPNRTVTIQLTRDTLILIAALVFLAIAILLAFIFPSQSSEPGVSSSTSVAAAGTARPSVVRATSAAAPTGEGASIAAGTAAAGATADSFQPEGGYPAPEGASQPTPTLSAGAAAEQQLTQTPEGSAATSVAQAPTIPPFEPSRPTQPAVGTPGGFSTQTTAYPGPATPQAGQEEATEQPTSGLIEAPTAQPTTEPTTEPTARPTARPEPTRAPTGSAPTPRPRATAAPTPPPVDVLRGNVRWTAAQSPIFVRRDLQLVAGATLIIDPGVEVRVAPGASFFVEGTLYGLGKPGQPVRFVGASQGRWEGIYGRPGSNIALEDTEIRGGGNGGTVLLSEGGNLVLHHARVSENGGHIQVTDSRLEVRDSEIAGNDMPYGSALEASYTGGNGVILTNNRIGGNRLQPGTSPVRISSQSALDVLNLDIEGNLLVGTEGPDLALFTNGPLLGGMTCNTFVGGPDGLSLRSDLPQVPSFALNVRDNAIEKHTPPIIPIYLQYGIGRGATSEIALDMRNNWWGSPLGPYDPERNSEGRGEAVGDNIEFGPWLTARPACAPQQ